MKRKKQLKFIDLFAGIGGFHQAVESLGGECVLASEIDSYAIETYKNNYNISSDINIRDIKDDQIPDHEMLCAGFPCQTFSKAGKQLGFNDETKGTLFFEIERIINIKHPKYIVLENVRNLVSHDNGRTWAVIQSHLKQCGYRTTKNPLILSPHQFGIPQLRERVIILGLYDPENIEDPLKIEFDELMDKEDNSIYSVLDKKNKDKELIISEYENNVLDAWDKFYKGINRKVIGFPVWIDFFKESQKDSYPKWKNEFIKKNNELYKENKEFIDQWIEDNNNFANWVPTHKKFEWQCGEKIKSVWDGLIQFRPSGIRVKAPTCFPALVAMVQIPIIGKYKRRLSVREAARLQSFPEDFIPCSNDQQAYKQFGNAVNVEVIRKCVKKLLNYND